VKCAGQRKREEKVPFNECSLQSVLLGASLASIAGMNAAGVLATLDDQLRLCNMHERSDTKFLPCFDKSSHHENTLPTFYIKAVFYTVHISLALGAR
jgi:hypothetical protein